jgi:phage tail-like protein
MYPPVGFHFKVEFNTLDDTTAADVRFQEVSGLSAEVATEEIVEGGENRFTHRVPTRGKFQNITLRRGLVNDSRLISWFKDAVDRLDITPADLVISLLNEDHEPLASWNVVGSWPIKWSASDFKAQDNAIVIESVELAIRYFRRLT